MNLRALTAGAGLMCGAILAIAAHAGENEHKIKIMTVDDQGGEPFEFQFSTEHNLTELRDGESRVITGNDGETVTVTRAGDQMTILTSEGQEVQVPFMGSQKIHVAHSSGKSAHKNVRVIRKHSGEPSNDIMVVAPGGLTDYEKQVLRDALAAAGSDKELHFVGDGIHGEIDIEIESSD